MSGQHCENYDVKTGNSSLLPTECWPLLHMIAGISARVSNFAFVLFCYVTNHLMTGPLGNREFCFPQISMFPSTLSWETLRFSGNKIHCSPRDQSWGVNCWPLFTATWNHLRWNHLTIALYSNIFHLCVWIGRSSPHSCYWNHSTIILPGSFPQWSVKANLS